MTLKVYLDNCCFNRPFDDQNQVRVRIETEAKLFIQMKMSKETEIKERGIRALLKELGEIDTEIFIKMIMSEPFDYTKWQRNLWNEKSVDQISSEAMNQQNNEKH